MYRSTKAARQEAEKEKLTGTGTNIVNPKERLLNYQKRQKLKDLLVTKFMKKYGIEHFHIELLEETDKPEEKAEGGDNAEGGSPGDNNENPPAEGDAGANVAGGLLGA